MQKLKLVKYLSALSILLVSLVWGEVAVAKSLKASVDRNPVSIIDTFTLKLEATGIITLSEPDLSTLDKEFNIVAKNVSHNIQNINGVTSQSVVWKIQLQPKKLGKVLVPSFSLSGVQSQEFLLEVIKAKVTGQDNDDFQLQLLSNKTNAKPNEQIIVTLRFSFSQNVNSLKNSELSIDDTQVIRLEDKSYETSKNGKNFGVYEISYAVFASSAGVIEIPAQQIRVQLGRSTVFSNNTGKTISMQSEPLSIEIATIDDSNASVLVADSFQIQEKWSNTAQSLNLGDSLTREISMQLTGARAQTIPPLQMSEVKGFKVYPEPAIKAEQKTSSGLVTSRSRKFAIVPTLAGEFIIPAMHYKWWNSTEKQYQTITLPERIISVIDAEKTSENALTQIQSNQQVLAKQTKDLVDSAENSATSKQKVKLEKVFVEHPLNLWLVIINIVLLTGVILLLILWLKARRNVGISPSQSMANSVNDKSNHEEKLFNQLLTLTKNADEREIYQGLLLWAKSSDLKGWHSTELANNIHTLEQHLYGISNHELQWDKTEFIKQITFSRKAVLAQNKQSNSSNVQHDFTELYPSNKKKAS